MTKAPSATPINQRIATRVAGLRAGQRLSLDALSAKSGVSRSMLSLVERGEASPTAVVLEKVATGLGVPLAMLFDDATSPPSPLSRAADRSVWKDPESGYTRRNISPANYPSPIRIVEVELPPGARVAYETAEREPGMHQQVWVRRGTIELTVGHAVHSLAEDDCLAMALDKPLTFRNRTRKTARYVVVITTGPGPSRRK